MFLTGRNRRTAQDLGGTRPDYLKKKGKSIKLSKDLGRAKKVGRGHQKQRKKGHSRRVPGVTFPEKNVKRKKNP